MPSSLSRAFGVLLWPRASMGDVVRHPDWQVPLLLVVVAALLFHTVYVVRADLVEVENAALRDAWYFQWEQPEDRQAILDDQRRRLQEMPALAFHLDGWIRAAVSHVTVLQGLTLLLAGLFWWAGHRSLPLRRGAMNLLFSLSLLALVWISYTILNWLLADVPLLAGLLTLVATGLLLVPWLNALSFLGQDAEYGALLGVVAHGMMVWVPVHLIGALVAAAHGGLVTPMDQLAPTSLGRLIWAPGEGGALGALLTAPDLAWLWFWVLVVAGLRRITGWEASKVWVLAASPWVAWTLITTVFSMATAG